MVGHDGNMVCPVESVVYEDAKVVDKFRPFDQEWTCGEVEPKFQDWAANEVGRSSRCEGNELRLVWVAFEARP